MRRVEKWKKFLEIAGFNYYNETRRVKIVKVVATRRLSKQLRWQRQLSGGGRRKSQIYLTFGVDKRNESKNPPFTYIQVQ